MAGFAHSQLLPKIWILGFSAKKLKKIKYISLLLNATLKYLIRLLSAESLEEPHIYSKTDSTGFFRVAFLWILFPRQFSQEKVHHPASPH